MGNNESSSITKKMPLTKQESLKKIAEEKSLHFSSSEISGTLNEYQKILSKKFYALTSSRNFFVLFMVIKLNFYSKLL